MALDSKTEKALRILLASTWVRLARLTKLELLKVLQPNVNGLNKQLVNQILQQNAARINEIHFALAEFRGKKILGSIDFNEPDLQPLKALLTERTKLLKNSITKYRFILNKSAIKLLGYKKTQDYSDLIGIGRRGQDMIREFTLSSLEKSFLTGNPTTLTKSELFKKIISDKSLGAVLQPDGRWTFPLEIKPYDGKFKNFDVEYYSELTARTTAHLADQEAFTVEAIETGGFLKFNSTGISKSKYRKEGDDKCAEIDGNVFSAVPGKKYGKGKRGSQGASGKWYEYIRDVLKGFLIAHPNCNHIAKPIPAEVV